MPKIYELLGYPITDTSPSVIASRKRAYCPFISDICDGGGNRFMSNINLREHPELHRFFSGLDADNVPSGICSIQLTEDAPPWIICPRRLLYMGRHADERVLNSFTQNRLVQKCGFPAGSTIGVWAETKVKYQDTNENEEATAFDYTFDYVLMPLGRVCADEAVEATNLEWNTLKGYLQASDHTFAQRNGITYIEDFPIGSPVVVEVMTSSTSGGNKRKRTCIPQAFEDCLLNRPHSAPGINYRQVWARMASQLIVKSQAALSWNGKTIWVLQDLLADYISSSTALDLLKFIAENTSEVNILAFSYGENFRRPQAESTVDLNNSQLYAGPIRADAENPEPSFQDIVLASVCPPREVLISALSRKKLTSRLHIALGER